MKPVDEPIAPSPAPAYPLSPPRGRRLPPSLSFRHPEVVAATWMGAGLLPLAPGTWGSLAALPLAWGIVFVAGPLGLAVAALAVFLLGWWASAAVEKRGALHDSGFIVIDEVVGQWIVLLPAPLDPLAYAVGFVSFRVCDIVKPWPASWADQCVEGGIGCMLDDLIAAVYGLAVMGLLAAAFWTA